jgi:hypothetical protein
MNSTQFMDFNHLVYWHTHCSGRFELCAREDLTTVNHKWEWLLILFIAFMCGLAIFLRLTRIFRRILRPRHRRVWWALGLRMRHRLFPFLFQEPQLPNIVFRFGYRPDIQFRRLRRFNGGFREWWRGLVDPVDLLVLWEMIKLLGYKIWVHFFPVE